MTDSMFGQFNLSDQLTEGERAIRDLFVEEYLRDFDPVSACLRIGFNMFHATQYADTFMKESYVAKQIREAYENEPENQIERDRALVLNTLRQASQHGPYNTRVAAAKTLASIHGFDKGQAASNSSLEDLLKGFYEKQE